MEGPCSCGLYHDHSDSCSCNNSYSTLFNYTPYDEYAYQDHHHHHHHGDNNNNNNMYGFSSWPSPNSSVDCTLSLGTPSTRLSTNENDHQNNNKRDHQQRRSSFSWNIFHSNKHSSSSSSAASAHKSHRGGNAGSTTNSGGADPLSARRCANCDTTSTPLWRNGPRGPKSLCNACGIRFKKEERRAAAATNCGGGSGGAAPVMDTQHMTNSPWVHHQQYFSSSSAYGNEYRFMEDDHHDHHDNADSGMPFFSWHLNVRS